jgi:hypothetical protein
MAPRGRCRCQHSRVGDELRVRAGDAKGAPSRTGPKLRVDGVGGVKRGDGERCKPVLALVCGLESRKEEC